jgi:hypothetical protein
MWCCPRASEEVLKLALPPLTVTVRSVLVPSLKVTVPVGVPPNCPAMVAVKVTDCPAVEGFKDEDKVLVVAALLMVCESAADVLSAKFAFPA